MTEERMPWEIAASDQVDAMISEINATAERIGAPWALRRTASGGVEAHPDLVKIFKENPDIFNKYK